MLVKLLTWLRGYLYIKVIGYSPERFFNLCSKRNINIWNITHYKINGINEYYFYIKLKDYKSIKPIVRKTRVRPFIVKRKGFPFFIYKNKKKKGFFIGAGLCIFLVYIMSLYIWDIDISGGYKYTSDKLMQYLNSNGIKTGMKIKEVDAFEIERGIRNTYNDIGWVSAEVKGTRLIIKINETNMPSIAKKDLNPSHIIADKEGEIIEIITRTGTPMVKAGDIVEKGDVLISGILNVMSDFNEVMNKKLVIADGDIRIKTKLEYCDKLPINHIQKYYTNSKKRGIIFNSFNKKINLYYPRTLYDKYDIIVNEKKIHITNSFYLPFSLSLIEINEYNEVSEKYTKEEAVKILNKNFNIFKEILEQRDTKIIENNIEISIENNIYVAKGTLILNEPAIKYREIEVSEWRTDEIDEDSRNTD